MANRDCRPQVINNYWTRLSKIIDLRDTDKSRYFAITEFNNCFIIRSPSLFFLMNIFGKWSDLPFSRKKEKSTVSFTHVQNIICSQTQLNVTEHEQTIICRQLFAGHVVSSRPMKRKNNLRQMIIPFIRPHMIPRDESTLNHRFLLKTWDIFVLDSFFRASTLISWAAALEFFKYLAYSMFTDFLNCKRISESRVNIVVTLGGGNSLR